MKPLRVRMCDEGASEPSWSGLLADLSGANPDGENWAAVEGELRRCGRCWVGGGASPLVLLMVEG